MLGEGVGREDKYFEGKDMLEKEKGIWLQEDRVTQHEGPPLLLVFPIFWGSFLKFFFLS